VFFLLWLANARRPTAVFCSPRALLRPKYIYRPVMCRFFISQNFLQVSAQFRTDFIRQFFHLSH
jgi:hypothetical protein